MVKGGVFDAKEWLMAFIYGIARLNDIPVCSFA